MDRDSELCKQVDDLTAINTELLEALKRMVSLAKRNKLDMTDDSLNAEAIISRAEGRS